MQLSAGMRHARMTLSPIARQSSLLSHITAASQSRHLRTLASSPLRPTVLHPRLYGQFSPWQGPKKHGVHTSKHDAGSRVPVLRRLGGTSAAISEDVRRQLMDSFLVKVDRSDPAPARYSLKWCLRHIYEAQPTRRIELVVPDEASCEAACEALQKVCNRWDGLVGALRNSYVCIIVWQDTIDALRRDLEQDRKLDFMHEVWMHCAVDGPYEMDAVSAPSGSNSHLDASRHIKDEPHRLLLKLGAHSGKSILVDSNTVEVRDPPSDSAAASLDTNNFNLDLGRLTSLLKSAASLAPSVLGTACLITTVVKAMSGRDESHGSSNREQEQHHGESHNHGKSDQRSAMEAQNSRIRAGGDVNIETNIYHGCDANPLSSSSPTVGNNQPNGNEGLSQKQ